VSTLPRCRIFRSEWNPNLSPIGDFNNDGKKDLAVCNRGSQNVSILLGDGAGSFGAATNFAVSPEPFALDIGDFNNDGKSDVVVSSPNVHTVWLMLGESNGALGTPVGFDVGEIPQSSRSATSMEITTTIWQ
jgi:hypothetical protein